MAPTDDAELVSQANAGDPRAFEALYGRHRSWALALAWRLTGSEADASDVLQEVFSYVFGLFPGFVLTTTSLRSYLFPIVRHRSLDLIRKRRKVVDIDEVRGGREVSYLPEVSEDIQTLLDSLPEGHSEVVRLRFVLGLKLPEIGEALDLPVGTVKSRLHNALKSLKKQHFPEEGEV